MTDLIFFYGTLMSAYRRPRGLGVDPRLTLCGRGSIAAALYDFGRYPGAIPASDGRVTGEIHRMTDTAALIEALDAFEDSYPGRPEDSLFVRAEVPVTDGDGHIVRAWVYFYNASVKRGVRVEEGDYLQYLKTR